MKNDISNSWKILLFNGLLAILYGVLAIFASEGLIMTIVIYVGILILISAGAMLYGAYVNYKNNISYGNDLFQAVLMLALGILLTFYSKQSAQVLVILFGSWALLLGLSMLYYAFKLPEGIHSKKTMIINSALTIILGIILLFNPFKAASFMVIVSGVIALLIGIILIVIAVKVKNYQE